MLLVRVAVLHDQRGGPLGLERQTETHQTDHVQESSFVESVNDASAFYVVRCRCAGRQVNVTICFSGNQALLAANAGTAS